MISSNGTSSSSKEASDSTGIAELQAAESEIISSTNKSRASSRCTNSNAENSSTKDPQDSFGHRRENSNVSSASGKSSIQSEIDRLSQTGMVSEDIKITKYSLSDVENNPESITERNNLIAEQINENHDLPPVPSTPIFERLSISSSLRSGSNFRSQHLVRRNCPPPIPPRLSERRKKVSGLTVVEENS